MSKNYTEAIDQEELNDFYTDDDDFYDDFSDHKGNFAKKLLYLIIVIVLLVILILVGVFLYNYNLQPVDSSNTNPKIVTIEEGMTTSEVGQLLQDVHMVRNGLVFTSYVGRHSYGGASIQAGNYELSQSMSVAEITTKLLNGDAYLGVFFTLTIPEGYNLNEEAAYLEQQGLCTADEFRAEASNITKYQQQFPILDSIPAEEIPQRTLEGYLFPNTYEVAANGQEGAELLVTQQLTEFTKQYSEELIAQTEADGKTVDEVVILASIVELETKLPEDRSLAASVFYNRMAQNIPLQSDITIDYINGTKTDVLTTEQTQVPSPYNTYINLGLPLGPICNPGLASIEACVYPAESNYLYFVADMSTGKLHFNETLDGHNQDVQTYLGD